MFEWAGSWGRRGSVTLTDQRCSRSLTSGAVPQLPNKIGASPGTVRQARTTGQCLSDKLAVRRDAWGQVRIWWSWWIRISEYAAKYRHTCSTAGTSIKNGSLTFSSQLKVKEAPDKAPHRLLSCIVSVLVLSTDSLTHWIGGRGCRACW